jgi:hypothetical protein
MSSVLDRLFIFVLRTSCKNNDEMKKLMKERNAVIRLKGEVLRH